MDEFDSIIKAGIIKKQIKVKAGIIQKQIKVSGMLQMVEECGTIEGVIEKLNLHRLQFQFENQLVGKSIENFWKTEVLKIVPLPPDKEIKIDRWFLVAFDSLRRAIFHAIKCKETEDECWKKIDETFEDELIEFIKPYQKVPLFTIAKHFITLFTTMFYKTDYGQMVHIQPYSIEGGYPYSKTILRILPDKALPNDLIEKFKEAYRDNIEKVFLGNLKVKVKTTLDLLIKTDKIQGYIRPFGDELCYFILESALPPIIAPRIHIGDKTNIQTGDISISIGGQNYCPKCGYKIDKEWSSCPQCTSLLNEPVQAKIYCTNCGKKVQSEWKVCPYCSSNI